MIVRLAREYRGNPEAIRRIPIGTILSGSGATVQIPLGDVADVQLISGPSFIYREAPGALRTHQIQRARP